MIEKYTLVPVIKGIKKFFKVGFIENIGRAGVLEVIEIHPHIMFGVPVVCI